MDHWNNHVEIKLSECWNIRRTRIAIRKVEYLPFGLVLERRAGGWRGKEEGNVGEDLQLFLHLIFIKTIHQLHYGSEPEDL